MASTNTNEYRSLDEQPNMQEGVSAANCHSGTRSLPSDSRELAGDDSANDTDNVESCPVRKDFTLHARPEATRQASISSRFQDHDVSVGSRGTAENDRLCDNDDPSTEYPESRRLPTFCVSDHSGASSASSGQIPSSISSSRGRRDVSTYRKLPLEPTQLAPIEEDDYAEHFSNTRSSERSKR